MNYQILTESTPDELRNKVMTALSEGWELQGGVSVSGETDDYNATFAQAMIQR